MSRTDTHLHFYDQRHPTAPNAVLRPPDATPDDYRRVQQRLGLERLVVVQPTTYGLNNQCQLDAMASFGDAARGVMVVGPSTPLDEIRRLTDLGVRGARFHMLPGGALPWDALAPTAERIAPFGWHIQLQVNGRELTDHEQTLRSLATPLVIDHIGRFTPPPDVEHPSVRLLLSLVEAGDTWVKLSAPYEGSQRPPDYADQDPIIEALVHLAPERLVWASNWPHPGQTDPLTADDLERLLDRWLPSPELREMVLSDNPAVLYDF